MRPLLMAVMIVSGIGVLASSADTHYVSGAGSGAAPYTSWVTAARAIQLAVDAAADGDTVLVNDGTYFITTEVVVAKSVTLKSQNGAQRTTILNTWANRRCLNLTAANGVVDGFTIRNGQINPGSGGGVRIGFSGILRNCVVRDNRATGFGGGVLCENGGLVENCTIENNSAPSGGGVYCYRGGLVQYCTIQSNTASASGGGIAMYSSNTIVRFCQVNANKSNLGGGMYLDTRALAENCRVVGNHGRMGGGIYLYGSTARRCYIEYNHATNGWPSGRGAGVFMYGYGGGPSPLLGESTVRANLADDRAGGVAVEYWSARVQNTVVAFNTAISYAGGIHLNAGGTVYGCTIISNQVIAGSGGGVHFNNGGTMYNSIAYYNNAGVGNNFFIEGAGGYCAYSCTKPLFSVGNFNFTTEPGFNNSDGGGYRLLAASPCVNAGTVYDPVGMALMADAAGNARLRAGTVDIGAVQLGGQINDFKRKGFSTLAVTLTDATSMRWYACKFDGTIHLWDGIVPCTGALAVPGDYNGDGRADMAAYRPSTGAWFVRRTGGVYQISNVTHNVRNAIPVPGDYNGGGSDDLALFEPSQGRWHIFSADSPFSAVIANGVQWGTSDGVPVAGDYDGDGRADMAIFFPALGTWYIRSVSGNVIASGAKWGFSGCIPVPCDYDGDGRSDLALFHPQTGTWYIRDVVGTVLLWNYAWGFNGCTPIIGDFNGGGRAELAVYYRPSALWYIVDPRTSKVLANGLAWGGVGMPAVKP